MALNYKNEIYNHKDELFDSRNKIEIKYNNFSIFEEK